MTHLCINHGNNYSNIATYTGLLSLDLQFLHPPQQGGTVNPQFSRSGGAVETVHFQGGSYQIGFENAVGAAAA